MIERKCKKCGTWNKDERECINCGALMRYEDIRAAEVKKLREEEAQRESRLVKFMEKTKNHKNILVRFTYHVAFSISVIIGAFSVFAAWLAALANA